MKLDVDVTEVRTAINEIKDLISKSEVLDGYDKLIDKFADSKGDQATAIQDLVKAEKGMTEETLATLSRLSSSIKTAAETFSQMDVQQAAEMAKLENPSSVIRPVK